MLIQRFKKKENEDFGSPGWLLVGAPSSYFPLSGLGVAHDILEHKRKDEGTIEHELLAFGATLYIRGEGGYWWRKGNVVPPGSHIGSEIGNDLGIKYEGVANGIKDPGRTLKLESHVEEWIHDSLREARQEINQLDDVLYTQDQIDAFLNRARGWLRKGYRMAAQRYKGIDVNVLSHLFAEIETKADQLLSEDEAEWSEMVVKINPRKGHVQVYLDVNYEEEWN